MAMTTSELSIVVKSQGIKDATTDLTNLAKAASSVDAETKAFVIAQQKLAEANTKTSKTSEMTTRGVTAQELAMIKAQTAANKMNEAMTAASVKQQILADNKLAKELERQEKAADLAANALQRNGMAMAKAHEQALKMNDAFDKHAKGLDDVTRRGNVYVNTLRSMATAALAYVGVNFFTGIVKEGDAWAAMQAKLDLAVGSMAGAKLAQQDLFDISQKLRVPIEDTTKLFTRMSVPLLKMGQTTADVKKVVESFSTALKLGGATGQEASSAMLQLSQSFNAGRLNGGEFNSVAEAAPSVLRAIEKELVRTGKAADVSSINLKKFAEKGLITTEVMSEALKRAAPQWEEDFKKLPLTVDGVMTRIKNSWQKAIGEMSQDTKFNEKLAESLMKLEKELPRIAEVLGKALLFVVNNAELLVKGFAAIVGAFAITHIIEAGAAFAKLAQSIGLVTAAGNLLGLTPVGKIILGITAAVGAGVWAWDKYTTSVDETSKKVQENNEKIPNIIKAIEEETRALNKRNEALEKELGLRNTPVKEPSVVKEIKMGDLSPVKQAFAELNLSRMRMEDAKKAFANRKDNVGAEALRQAVIDTEQNYRAATIQIEAVKKLYKEQQAAENAVSGNTFLANRKKTSEALIELYKTDNQKAKDIREKDLADLKAKVEAGLVTKTAEAAARIGIERKYQESLDKVKKIKPQEDVNDIPKMHQEIDVREKLLKSVDDYMKVQEKQSTQAENSLNSTQLELEKTRLLIAQYGDKKQALIDLQIIEATADLNAKSSVVRTAKEIFDLTEKIRLLKELKGEQTTLTALDVGKDNLDKLDKFLDSNKLDRFGKSFSGSMGEVGKSVVNVTKVLQNMSKVFTELSSKEAILRKDREAGGISQVDFETRLAKLQEARMDVGIDLFGDMSEAAKGFFEEGSKGYKTLDGISEVVHAAQMARNLVEMGQLAVKAVMNQAGGDPYSAWARMGAMAAAMAALGYAVGGGFNSNNGGMKAADVQKTQGSGTVFGDAEAKSDSVAKSIDMLKKSTDKLYPVNQGMLKSLQNIESSMAGLANLVVRSGGIAEGTNLGIKEGTLSQGMGGLVGKIIPIAIPVIGSLISRLWGKTTQNIVDSGVQFGGSLSGLKSGRGLNQYASVDTTSSSWFGLKKNTSNSVQTQGMSDEVNKQIGMVFTNMQTTLEEAGKALYGSSTKITEALNNMVFETSKISLKGLSGDALTSAINNVISKALDQMAGTAFANLEQYRTVGEGYAETVIRVANSFVTTNAVMSKFNYTLFEMSDAGIKASMAFTEMFGNLENLQSVTSSYFENFYREEDQVKIKTEAVAKIMKSLGQEMPTTREGFKLLVDTAQKAGNLELVANLMKVSSAFAEVVQWVEKVAVASEKMDYTNTDQMFPDWTTFRDNLKETINDLSQTAQKWLSVSKQANDIRAQINTVLWGSEATREAAVKKSEKLWKMMASDITVEQKLSIAGELKDSIISKYQIERESITKMIDFTKQLRTYVDGLKLGSLSPLTMTQKLAEARRQYEATLTKAQAGDTIAQGALTGSANTYLELARTAYASSDAYQAIFNNITNSLDAMNIDSRSAEEKLVALNQAQNQELINLVIQMNTIESVADSYYKTTVANMGSQLTVLNNLYTKMGVFDGIAVDVAGLPAELAAALSGTFGRASGADYVTALYSKFANKTGNQIDAEGMAYWTREFELYGREYVLKAFQDSVEKVNAKAASMAPPPMSPTSTVDAFKAEIADLKKEIALMREDAQVQTVALMNTLIETSKLNAETIVEGTQEGLDKNNPTWNKVTFE